MHTVFGQAAEDADTWEWQNASTNWEETVVSPECELIEYCNANFHACPCCPSDDRGRQGVCV